MVNYYEELNLDKNASASELMKELVRLEVIWHKNEIKRPELAAEKLVMISQAKKVFASDAAKIKYDNELFAAPEDPDAARRAQFKKWYEDAQAYFDSAQYDLAKTALENAMQNISDEDPAFYNLAASIYYSNDDTSMAMTCINKAIVMQPDEARYYLFKGVILEKMYSEALRYRGDKADDYLLQERETLRRAAELAVKANNSEICGCAIGYLAYSLYFYRPTEPEQAEAFAKEAVKIGDVWGNGQKVIDDAEKKRDDARRREEERRLEEERRKRAALEWEEKRKQQAREAQAANLRRKSNTALMSLLMILSLAGMVLTLVLGLTTLGYVSGLPRLSYQALAALAALCLFTLNFSNNSPYGPNGGFVSFANGLFGLYNCIILPTIRYTKLGYSQASTVEAWKLVGILIVVFVVSSFLGAAFGGRMD